MYGCESWTVEKAECWGIDACELWCWRRLLWVPWTARRSNQSILKETRPGCSLDELMIKLKLQYFGHLMPRVDSLENTLMLGGIGGRRRRGRQRMRWLDGLDGQRFGWTPGVGDGQGGLACCNSMGRKESDTTEQLNWTDGNWVYHFRFRNFSRKLWKSNKTQTQYEAPSRKTLMTQKLTVGLVFFLLSFIYWFTCKPCLKG